MTDVPIGTETIDLDQFLKLCGVAGTGGQAKWLIVEGRVTINGEVETRRRRMLKAGDEVEAEGEVFAVVGAE